MEVGDDSGVIAVASEEGTGGKTLADTKVRYSWVLSLDGQKYRIDFTNSRTSGKKRVFVDGRLQHESRVYRSPHFQYTWPMGQHLVSIVPKEQKHTLPTSILEDMKALKNDVVGTVDCQFELRINGLPFSTFKRRPARPNQQGASAAANGRVNSTSSAAMPRADPRNDPHYVEMQRQVEEVLRRREAESSRKTSTSPWADEQVRRSSDQSRRSSSNSAQVRNGRPPESSFSTNPWGTSDDQRRPASVPPKKPAEKQGFLASTVDPQELDSSDDSDGGPSGTGNQQVFNSNAGLRPAASAAAVPGASSWCSSPQGHGGAAASPSGFANNRHPATAGSWPASAAQAQGRAEGLQSGSPAHHGFSSPWPSAPPSNTTAASAAPAAASPWPPSPSSSSPVSAGRNGAAQQSRQKAARTPIPTHPLPWEPVQSAPVAPIHRRAVPQPLVAGDDAQVDMSEDVEEQCAILESIREATKIQTTASWPPSASGKTSSAASPSTTTNPWDPRASPWPPTATSPSGQRQKQATQHRGAWPNQLSTSSAAWPPPTTTASGWPSPAPQASSGSAWPPPSPQAASTATATCFGGGQSAHAWPLPSSGGGTPSSQGNVAGTLASSQGNVAAAPPSSQGNVADAASASQDSHAAPAPFSGGSVVAAHAPQGNVVVAPPSSQDNDAASTVFPPSDWSTAGNSGSTAVHSPWGVGASQTAGVSPGSIVVPCPWGNNESAAGTSGSSAVATPWGAGDAGSAPGGWPAPPTTSTPKAWTGNFEAPVSPSSGWPAASEVKQPRTGSGAVWPETTASSVSPTSSAWPSTAALMGSPTSAWPQNGGTGGNFAPLVRHQEDKQRESHHGETQPWESWPRETQQRQVEPREAERQGEDPWRHREAESREREERDVSSRTRSLGSSLMTSSACGAPVAKAAPVPAALAGAFVEALRREYVYGEDQAVGRFFDEQPGVSDAEERLTPFEESVRAAPSPEQAISELEAKWGVVSPSPMPQRNQALVSTAAPVPAEVARGFVRALRSEYVHGIENAVGDFFDEQPGAAEAEVALQPFEDAVRVAPNREQAIADLERRWRLRPRTSSVQSPMATAQAYANAATGKASAALTAAASAASCAPKPAQPVQTAGVAQGFVVPSGGKRRAVLVGINYFGTRAELRGCINDVHNMRRLLTESFGWPNSCIRALVDDDPAAMPTRANIATALRWLVDDVRPGDVLFFHFSGHGAQQEDPNGYEEDGMNETICPVDFQSAGMMTDDELGELIVKHLPEGVRLTAIMDCCHSGTGLDLPFTYTDRGWREETNPYHSRGDVQLFSGCEDEQTSADASSGGVAGGAMTAAFCELVRDGGIAIPYPELMNRLHQVMRRRGFSQRPQLTSSQAFDHDRPFLLDDVIPNSNHSIGRTFRRKFPPRPRKMDGPLADMLGLGVAVVGGMVAADMAMSMIGGLLF